MDNKLEKIRHSLSHLMAQAVMEIFPQVRFGIGPSIANGFYYDFDLPRPISPQELPKIEKRVKSLIKQNLKFEKVVSNQEKAKNFYKNQPFKLELVSELAQKKQPITFYKSGKFIDLCSGPHVESTKEIPADAFKLLKVAGAYWRGNANNKMLQRIYGVAFATKKELDKYLKQIEEAAKRDHRRLGQEQELFAFSELIGSGLPLYLPRGTTLMNEINNYLKELKKEQGYEQVDIPHLAKDALYKTSGHWEKFKDDIFHVKGKTENFILKPMNCPHHAMIFAALSRSYRNLPVRLAEVTKQYRDEQTGELHGLSRVRSITIDDTHIFCRPDQTLEETERAYKIIKKFNKTFGFPLSVELSTRDPKQPQKYLGGNEVWKKAEATLVVLLKKLKLKYTVHEGEAAFYGPKIDFKTKDSLGREWQMSTIQLDFNLPERFKLEYTDNKGGKTRPVMIHIAVAGSIERFLSVIIEHYAGAFPTWLSPVQVKILTVGKAHIKYAKKLHKQFLDEGIRSELDDANDTVGYKIRQAEKQKVPYMLVVGDKEIKGKSLNVRIRGQKALKKIALKTFVNRIKKEIKEKK